MTANCPAANLVIDAPIKTNKDRGTRVVYRGRYYGRPVIVKAYSHPFKRRIDWFLCHYHGRVLRRRGVPAPDIHYSGYAPSLKRYVIIYEHLAGDGDFYWIRTEPERSRRLVGYMKLVRLLAVMHGKGIAQKDTTPGNFLESDGTIYALDEDRMDVRPWPRGKRASLDNLASLITQFPPEARDDTDRIGEVYMKERGWDMDDRWRQYLARRIDKFRAWRSNKRGFYYTGYRGALVMAAIGLAFIGLWLLV